MKTDFQEVAPPNEQNSTIVTADFMNLIFNTNGGHRHNGGSNDGSCDKIDVNEINYLDVEHNVNSGGHKDISWGVSIRARTISTGVSKHIINFNIIPDTGAKDWLWADDNSRSGIQIEFDFSNDTIKRRIKTNTSSSWYDNEWDYEETFSIGQFMLVYGRIYIRGQTVSDQAEASDLSTDTVAARYVRRVDGYQSWGSGASALDTHQYREASGILRTLGVYKATNGFTIASAGASGFAHQATAKTLSFCFAHIIVSTLNPLRCQTQEGMAAPATGDSAYDYGHIPVHLPDGAEITGYSILGLTTTANDVVNAQLYRSVNGVSYTVGSGVSMTNGASTAATGTISFIVDNNYAYFFQITMKSNAGFSYCQLRNVYLEYSSSNAGQTI